MKQTTMLWKTPLDLSYHIWPSQMSPHQGRESENLLLKNEDSVFKTLYVSSIANERDMESRATET